LKLFKESYIKSSVAEPLSPNHFLRIAILIFLFFI
jgi:hypothetical protein